jgi:hypothetical protein
MFGKTAERNSSSILFQLKGEKYSNIWYAFGNIPLYGGIMHASQDTTGKCISQLCHDWFAVIVAP